jgi:hypothetical protein
MFVCLKSGIYKTLCIWLSEFKVVFEWKLSSVIVNCQSFISCFKLNNKIQILFKSLYSETCYTVSIKL